MGFDLQHFLASGAAPTLETIRDLLDLNLAGAQLVELCSHLHVTSHESPFSQFYLALSEPNSESSLTAALLSEPQLHQILPSEKMETLCQHESPFRHALLVSRLEFLLSAPEEHGEEVSEIYCELLDSADDEWKEKVESLGIQIKELRALGLLPRIFVNRSR